MQALGKLLGAKFNEVSAAIEALTADQLKELNKAGVLKLCGETVAAAHIVVKTEFNGNQDSFEVSFAAPRSVCCALCCAVFSAALRCWSHLATCSAADDLRCVPRARVQAASEDDCLVVIDVDLDEALVEEGLMREVVNRVQKLRKKAGLSPTDPIEVFYQLKEHKEDKHAAHAAGHHEEKVALTPS